MQRDDDGRAAVKQPLPRTEASEPAQGEPVLGMPELPKRWGDGLAVEG